MFTGSKPRNYHEIVLWTMQLQTLQYEIGVKVACIINKSPCVDEHAFPLTKIVSWMSSSTIIFMNSSCVVLIC